MNNYSFPKQKNVMRTVALFYVFANLLLSGLTETAQFSYLFVHSICCDILFWSKHMKKVSLTLVYSWKGRRS